MVERLKAAVEKARAQRAGERLVVAPQPEPAPNLAEAERRRIDGAWAALKSVILDERHLENHRIVTSNKNNPANTAFDALRVRILRVFEKNGWRRIGITSPTKGCGKTFVAANLALSLSRTQNNRTMLIDMDLRLPTLSKVLGVRQADPPRWFLTGETTASDFLRAVSPNLAVGVSNERLKDAAEVILDQRTGETLKAMETKYDPDVVIYDLPPLLSCEDVIGFLPNLDCVLLVAAGDRTRPDSVLECERLLADRTHLLGVLLNKAEVS